MKTARTRPARAGTLVAALVAAMLLPALAAAQSSPVGLWRNVDDKTGEAKAEVRIAEGANGLSGRVERVLKKDARPDEVCKECTDDRKGQPMAGLEIIRGGHRSDQGEFWEGGRILDPENGREYRLRLTPLEGGQKLQVRGFLGPFFRTQVWTRVTAPNGKN